MAGENEVILKFSADLNEIKKSLGNIEKTSKKTAEKTADNLEGAFSKVGLAIAGIGTALAGLKLVGIFGDSIEAAQVQEDAIKRLNTSLKLSGEFSEAASQDMQDYAASLQEVTRFGDEVILNQLALAKSFGATNDQAKKVVEAGLDLAEAFGAEVEFGIRNVAKTLGGYAGELGEIIPELKNFTTAQLQAGEGIDLIAAKFAGTAQQQAKTFSGAIDQLTNAFGDQLEVIGDVIIKNDAVIKLIAELRKRVIGLGRAFKDNEKAIIDFVTSAVDNIKELFSAISSSASTLLGVIVALTKGVIAFGVSLVGLKVAVLISNIGILQTALVGLTVSFGALSTAATVAWRAVGGPIGLIAVAIGVVVALFDPFIEKLKEAGKDSDSLLFKLENILRLGSGQKPLEIEIETDTKQVDEIAEELENKLSKRKFDIEIATKLRIEVAKAIGELDKLSEAIDAASAGARGKIVKEYQAQLKITENAIKLGGNAAKKGFAVRARLNEEFQKKISEIDKQENDKRQSELIKIFNESSKNISKGIRQAFATDKIEEFEEALAGTFRGLFNGINRGAAGSKDFVINELAIVLEESLGVVGRIIGFALDLAADGIDVLNKKIQSFVREVPKVIANIIQGLPFLVRTFVSELIKAVPSIILAIIESVPLFVNELISLIPDIIDAFVRGFIEKLPDIVVALVELLPEVIIGLVELLPQLISALIQQLPRIVNAFIVLIPRIIGAFVAQVPNIIIALIRLLPEVAIKFAEELIKNVPKIVSALIAGIVNGLGSIGGGLIGGIGKGIFGAVSGVVKGIGGFLGFAEGGVAKVVPQGFLNDTFPASLTSGELVVSRDDTERLRSFLDRQEDGSNNGADFQEQLNEALDQREQNLTVNLVVGEDQLANAILNLNRRGFRLA